MDSFLSLMLGAAMFATLVVLVVGVVSFAVNGKFYQRNSNKLMRLRVILQGLALAVFALITWLAIAPPEW